MIFNNGIKTCWLYIEETLPMAAFDTEDKIKNYPTCYWQYLDPDPDLFPLVSFTLSIYFISRYTGFFRVLLSCFSESRATLRSSCRCLKISDCLFLNPLLMRVKAKTQLECYPFTINHNNNKLHNNQNKILGAWTDFQWHTQTRANKPWG